MGTIVIDKDNIQDALLHKVWTVELEILDVIDHICRVHSIRYSLFYGTLLGTIRHQGFIPWDDDIDLVMPRKDYNRLMEILAEKNNLITDSIEIKTPPIGGLILKRKKNVITK